MNIYPCTKTIIFSIGLMISQLMYAGEEMVVFQDEGTPLVKDVNPEQNKKLLRHLTINNVINGAITLAGLTTLGVTSVTGTNNYPLATISTLAIGSLIQTGHQYYITRKLQLTNTNKKHQKRIDTLAVSGVADIAMSSVSLLFSIATQLTGPKINNVDTNVLLLVPAGGFGYLWSSIFQNHHKYKKLKENH